MIQVIIYCSRHPCQPVIFPGAFPQAAGLYRAKKSIRRPADALFLYDYTDRVATTSTPVPSTLGITTSPAATGP